MKATSRTFPPRPLRPLLVVLLAAASGQALADVSANIGWASDYYYRGIFQARSSASAGLDFSKGGFYAGTWATDVNDGLEVDAYFGYSHEIGSLSLGLGFTGYYYTQDFDDTYEELNFSAGFGIASIDVALGEYGNFAEPAQKYSWSALTVEKYGFHGRYAVFGREFSGDYFELGYERSLAELDVGLTLILADEELGDESELIFTIGKSFDFD
jgi:uncharacterized protein (TIGR02001 family)